MKAEDVTETLDMALAASGCNQARIVHKPRLLSDNGSRHVSTDLAEWLEAQEMKHVQGAPYHPQTQGSNAGIRLSRTAFCWRTIICREISKLASASSSISPAANLLRRRWQDFFGIRPHLQAGKQLDITARHAAAIA